MRVRTTNSCQLVVFLIDRIRASGVPQVTLASRTGFSQKHISQMLTLGEGSISAWDALLRAAGIEVGEVP